MGEEGAIERVLSLIKAKVEAGVSDEVLEVSWSFLWNITDETPENCSRFLRSNGMSLFSQCYEVDYWFSFSFDFGADIILFLRR